MNGTVFEPVNANNGVGLLALDFGLLFTERGSIPCSSRLNGVLHLHGLSSAHAF